ncbi:unnamed protein product, partial [Ascophyllum nodosum]
KPVAVHREVHQPYSCEENNLREDELAQVPGSVDARIGHHDQPQKAAKAEADYKISLLAAKAEAEYTVSLLRMQVKTLEKERNMDLKLLEGATRKINTLPPESGGTKGGATRNKPGEKEEEGQPALLVCTEGSLSIGRHKAPGREGRGTKMEANIWAAILEAERNVLGTA